MRLLLVAALFVSVVVFLLMPKLSAAGDKTQRGPLVTDKVIRFLPTRFLLLSETRTHRCGRRPGSKVVFKVSSEFISETQY